MVSDVVSARPTRSLWLAVLAGPTAWSLDELVSLAITGTACAGPGATSGPVTRLVMVVVGVVAIGVTVFGALNAARWLRELGDVHSLRGDIASNRRDRMRFMAMSALLLAAVSAFGITLRLITSVVTAICA